MTLAHRQADDALRTALARHGVRLDSNYLETQLAIAQARNAILREQLAEARYNYLVLACTFGLAAFIAGVVTWMLRG